MDKRDALRYRIAPLEMTPSEFRRVGRQLVERIAEFLCTLPNRPVVPNESPRVIREALGTGSLPEEGAEARDLLEEAATLLFAHSTFNGHPRFLGFITSSAAPIGALGDLLAAAINPNVGGWLGAPMSTEIEVQTIRWIAELIGYPTDCGGLLVSGGNMSNFVGFLAARKAKATWDVRSAGLMDDRARRLRVYTSSETHTWIQKATDMFGLGTDAIRWIPVDAQLRMDTEALRKCIQQDIEAGDLPFLDIGTAGTVSTGAVDPLPEIAAICREYDLWFHADECLPQSLPHPHPRGLSLHHPAASLSAQAPAAGHRTRLSAGARSQSALRFDVEQTVPCDYWLRQQLRNLDQGLLQALLHATVTALQDEIPGLGEVVAYDVKHIYANVKENNPRVSMKDRFCKDRQPKGDCDCRVGIKKSTNQEQPDGSKKVVKEYLWGYGSGVAAATTPDYGAVVIAENTGDQRPQRVHGLL